MSISIPIPLQSLSSAKTLSGYSIGGGQSITLATKLSHLSISAPGLIPFKGMPIRMGGGPRTYPGGVSKWQWKRMQAKKAKQLLKARLARERQIYEMRKRAELKAAVSELERPWETVEKPPNLFSVSADEQLKVLADRFQKPGGLDLWSERDGPELFRPDNGLPSMRFFPKGVVHSVKPYGRIDKTSTMPDEFETSGEDSVVERKGHYRNSRSSHGSSYEGENVNGNELGSVAKGGANGSFRGKVRKKGSRRKYTSVSDGMDFVNAGYHDRNDARSGKPGSIDVAFGTSIRYGNGEKRDSQVFEMRVQNDGVYGFELED